MALQDRRVRRTHHALARALIELTLEKGYDSITIRDITERADIGYATFFRHYEDKKALLRDVLQVVLSDLMEMLASLNSDNDPARMGMLLFQYVQEHSELVRVLLNSYNSSSIGEQIIQAGTQSILSKHAPREDSTVPAEIVAHHIMTASISLIQWWLDHDMSHPPERMGTIYRDLILQPARQIAFRV
jgi:AcrR family transcriptional regulator